MNNYYNIFLFKFWIENKNIIIVLLFLLFILDYFHIRLKF